MEEEKVELTEKEKNIIYKPEVLRLVCRNCNTEWTEERPQGYYVRCEKDNNFLIKQGDAKKNRKLFTCPNCHGHTKIGRLSTLVRKGF